MKLLSIFSFLSLFNWSLTQSSDCRSDTNNDNLIDVNDLLNVLSSYSTEDIESDVNNDLIVDVNDLLQVLGDFGEECNCSCCPEGALCIVPDPPCCNSICNLGDDCGGQLWTECGSSCPLICGQPESMICNMMCNTGYQCPHNLWWSDTHKMCVESSECYNDEVNTLPPDIAIGRPYIDYKNIKSVVKNEFNDWSGLI